MWEPWLNGERESWRTIKHRDHFSGGWMLCVCVDPAAVFSIHLLESCPLTWVFITRWWYKPLLVWVKPGYPCVFLRVYAHCRCGGGGCQVINASKRQLWSGLTHLEISLREERHSGRTMGRGRRRRCFHISCQINKSWESLQGRTGSGGEREGTAATVCPL